MRPITSRNMTISRSFSLVLLFVTMFIFTPFLLSVSSAPSSPIIGEPASFDGIYDWEVNLTALASSTDYITYHDFRNNVCRVETTVNNCISGLGNRKIRFDTAEELYRFSIDVSFQKVYVTAEPSQNVKLSTEKIAFLLSLYYVLGNDIDYSIMNAKTWSPVGYDFRDTSNVLYRNVFQGVFDGQGFTISNLYVAGYDYMIYVEQIDALNSIDIALSPYYSMFTINEGTIKNIGLINPTLELLDTHIDISKTSNLVGFNSTTGVVDHVFVIDTRSNVLDAGIRYRVGTATQSFSAAGIVHNNLGTFTNAFYSSKVVVNGSWINRFALQPALFENTGTIARIVYDSSVYLLNVTVGSTTFTINTPNALLHTAETTAVLKSSSSSLNTANDLWYFYQDDTYPQLLGLEYSDGYYLIENPIDLVFFSRLIGYNTIANGVSYGSAQYRLTTNIDMSIVAPGAYKTPSVNFNGLLTGYNESGTGLDDNFYIYNLNFSVGTIRGSAYYAGLFSVLAAGSVVEHLNINQSSIALTNTEAFYSNLFYIGMVSGRLSGGIIRDVLVDASVNLGTQAIGQTHAGGVVGDAAGIINRVSFKGTMNGGIHVYQSNYNIMPRFYIGGVVGSATANTLSLDDVVNNGSILGFSTTSTFNLAVGATTMNVRMGGVIGYTVFSATANHSFVRISNKGNITIRNVISTVSVPAFQSIGGVFGEIAGSVAPVLEVDGVIKNGNYYHSGLISGAFYAQSATIRAAGMGVINMSVPSEFALLYNHGNFDYNVSAATNPDNRFLYTHGVYSISTAKITLSRLYNHSNYAVSVRYYTSINPLYYSETNHDTLLRFSVNYGNVSFLNNSGLTQIVLAASSELRIAGITTSRFVDLLNVFNYGNITVVNVNIGSNRLFVSGLITELSLRVQGSPAVTTKYFIRNSYNEGKITAAAINGTMTFGNTTFEESPTQTISVPLQGGIFLAGIANMNYSGDLQDVGVTKASFGIINTVNGGEITTSFTEANNLFGTSGTVNTFAGGVVTLNSGSIQDVANLGNIRLYNSNTSSTMVIVTTATDPTQYFASLLVSYTGGVTAGGVAAVAISQRSYIFDTANIGDVIIMAHKYARAGGVLGVSLNAESRGGGIVPALGRENNVQNAFLSNGMNYGYIAALTNNIGTYGTSPQAASNIAWERENRITTNNMTIRITTTNGTNERPQINSSAGGVIGYGLSTMKRMLNHGTVVATDVAGGIIGSTYILGAADFPETVVRIDTAINYGLVKAVDATKVMTAGNPINPFNLTISNIQSFYYADNSTFIYPTGFTRFSPQGKRGIGGVFGRLQRGTNGIMNAQASAGGSFNLVVNANPNVDLIGRIDQVYNGSASTTAYRFQGATYYSAKWQDTTQIAFTGFNYVFARINSRTGTTNNYTYSVTILERWVQSGNTGTRIQSGLSQAGTFVSATAVANGNNRYFYEVDATVPWITENSTDNRITDIANQYMYHPNFPMRTDPELSQYIFYVEGSLLASRFLPGGANPRPSGMYVLSTSLGSQFGSVLPSNILSEKIALIDEDHQPPISLLVDYENLMTLAPVDSDLTDGLDSLKQTSYNDKSLLIEIGANTLVLQEQAGGANTTLSNGVLNPVSRQITFTKSMEAFPISQTSVSYQISGISASIRALAAIRLEDYYGGAPSLAQRQAFNNLLFPYRNQAVAGGALTPDLSANLPNHNITGNVSISLGFFTLYSEAFVRDIDADRFIQSAYYTEYEVIIVFTPKIASIPGGFLGIQTVQFNGAAPITINGSTDIRLVGNVNYNGSIRFNFLDEKSVLTEGYDFKDSIAIRYQDGTLVNPIYYTVTSIPVAIVGSNRTYSITITFSNQTRAGDYTMEYRYFPTSTLLAIQFRKAASPIANVLALQYYSSGTSVSIAGTTINSSVNLGTVLNIDASGTSFTSSTNNSLPSYLSNTSFNVNFMTANSFLISPFATLQSATLISTTYNQGYKTYHIRYQLLSESGAPTTFNHYIVERTINLTAVLKNGNEIDVADSFALREDLLTVFQVNLGLDSTLNLYRFTPTTQSYIDIQVTGQNLAGTVTYTPQQIVGITYRTVNNNALFIDMDSTTLPGNYVFTFRFYRDGQAGVFVLLQTTLTIQKRAGVDPYLKDIRFSEFANETSYPVIRITDINGNILTTTGKDPRVFFGGIDYDDADTAGYRFFRVDGQVSNISLVEYVPLMIDYLPFGATISRRAWNPMTEQWFWTTEVNAASSQSAKNTLIADFTVIPETGNEPGDNEEVVILYRVTSENGQTFTYYYITVTDIVFNVTLIFDIYFCTGPTFASCTLASESANFANQLVIISVKNFDTNGDSTVANVIDPQFYPTFSVINGLNNQMTQFYYTYSGMYRYSFGRNISGFYIFDLELPKDRYLNNRYDFSIEHQDFLLNNASNYIPGLGGKYFYIEAGTKNRTRRFNIYIRDHAQIQTGAPWGLFDFFRSWSTEEE